MKDIPTLCQSVSRCHSLMISCGSQRLMPFDEDSLVMKRQPEQERVLRDSRPMDKEDAEWGAFFDNTGSDNWPKRVPLQEALAIGASIKRAVERQVSSAFARAAHVRIVLA